MVGEIEIGILIVFSVAMVFTFRAYKNSGSNTKTIRKQPLPAKNLNETAQEPVSKPNSIGLTQKTPTNYKEMIAQIQNEKIETKKAQIEEGKKSPEAKRYSAHPKEFHQTVGNVFHETPFLSAVDMHGNPAKADLKKALDSQLYWVEHMREVNIAIAVGAFILLMVFISAI